MAKLPPPPMPWDQSSNRPAAADQPQGRYGMPPQPQGPPPCGGMPPSGGMPPRPPAPPLPPTMSGGGILPPQPPRPPAPPAAAPQAPPMPQQQPSVVPPPAHQAPQAPPQYAPPAPPAPPQPPAAQQEPQAQQAPQAQQEPQAQQAPPAPPTQSIFIAPQPPAQSSDAPPTPEQTGDDEEFEATVVLVRGRSATNWKLIDIDGSEFQLHRVNGLGRKPLASKVPDGAQIIALSDPKRVLSRTHVLIEVEDDRLWVTDLGSTNGTELIEYEGAEPIDCPTGLRLSVPRGASLSLGGRDVSFEAP